MVTDPNPTVKSTTNEARPQGPKEPKLRVKGIKLQNFNNETNKGDHGLHFRLKWKNCVAEWLQGTRETPSVHAEYTQT